MTSGHVYDLMPSESTVTVAHWQLLAQQSNFRGVTTDISFHRAQRGQGQEQLRCLPLGLFLIATLSSRPACHASLSLGLNLSWSPQSPSERNCRCPPTYTARGASNCTSNASP